MSGQHCESYDVKRETVHCYPVNSSLLTAVARNGWNLSAVFKFCFCFVLLYNKSRNDWSVGEQWILFPSNLNVSSRETLRFSGNKIHCSPRDQSLSVYCYQLTWQFKQIMHGYTTFISFEQVLKFNYETGKVFSFTPDILREWFCCEWIMNFSNINITLEIF